MGSRVPSRPLLPIREVAEELAVSERTVRRLIRRGELPVLHVGGQLRVDPDELVAWLYTDRSPLKIPEGT
jgi:excisionase family DNA binding protein